MTYDVWSVDGAGRVSVQSEPRVDSPDLVLSVLPQPLWQEGPASRVEAVSHRFGEPNKVGGPRSESLGRGCGGGRLVRNVSVGRALGGGNDLVALPSRENIEKNECPRKVGHIHSPRSAIRLFAQEKKNKHESRVSHLYDPSAKLSQVKLGLGRISARGMGGKQIKAKLTW